MSLGSEALGLGDHPFRGMQVVGLVQLREIRGIGGRSQYSQNLWRGATAMAVPRRMEPEPVPVMIASERVEEWCVQLSKIPEMTPLGK